MKHVKNGNVWLISFDKCNDNWIGASLLSTKRNTVMSQYKRGLSKYGDFYHKGKTVARPYFLIMGMPVPVRRHLYGDTGPCYYLCTEAALRFSENVIRSWHLAWNFPVMLTRRLCLSYDNCFFLFHLWLRNGNHGARLHSSTRAPFNSHGLTVIPAWISNHKPS